MSEALPSRMPGYRGRLAPSPTGYLHMGHARTFWKAQERARAAQGALVLRMEDLDGPRCRPEFVDAAYEDLRWFGFGWDEGPDVGGGCGPYVQSARVTQYHEAFEQLRAAGWLYPCTCSRKDILQALSAPHAGDEEPIYPGTCRDRKAGRTEGSPEVAPGRCAWRFRVPDGEALVFEDLAMGEVRFVAGADFGDFVVWRGDDLPSYQLACVVDDAAMRITEVVRGADLLMSTARQLLLYRALELPVPAFHHCALVTDAEGRRLAKRCEAQSLRRMREEGAVPERLREGWAAC